MLRLGEVWNAVRRPYARWGVFFVRGECMPIAEYGLAEAVRAGFWVAVAEPDNGRSALAVEVYPAPTAVEYPEQERSQLIETADGRVVVQTTSLDPRRRAWLWTNYSPTILTYERQYRWLESLKARTRYARQQSPYVYVFDGTTRLLDLARRLTVANASSNFTLNANGTVTVPALTTVVQDGYLAGATVELVGGNTTSTYQRRTVTAAVTAGNTTTLTLADPFRDGASVATNKGTNNLLLSWLQPVWWRARVVDTTRVLRNEGGLVRYSTTRFQFVIDDDVAELNAGVLT